MWQLSQAAAAVDAQLVGSDALFTGVTTDSRTLQAGDLFVALPGERFNGHDYIEQAAQRGAVAAMVSEKSAACVSLLRVADCYVALGRLAAAWRAQFTLPIIAITGSNGKTTVKEMLAAILREHAGAAAVLATRGNLNNNIGMPLTLLRLRESHRYAVIEMGMNHHGEISYLTRLAQPQVALINNAQAAHLEGLGTVEAVARAKAEIFEGVSATGWSLINADDTHLANLPTSILKGHILRFGLDSPADVTARYELRVNGSDMQLSTPKGSFAVALKVPGMHNVRNALAAIAAAVALEIPAAAISAGLETFTGVAGRLQRKPGLRGATIIDDTYNANPDSVRAAIAVLAATTGKKVLVLGDMGELGAQTSDLHAELGTYAKQAKIDHLLTLGQFSTNTAQSFGGGAQHFEDIEELLGQLENLLAPNVTVLVKGSRFMQMERITKRFET